MERWEIFHRQYMIRIYFELCISIIQKPSAENSRVHEKIVASKSPFDDNFPEACSAED